MKKLLSFSLLSIALAALSGCGPAKPTLFLYTWCDYIDPELVESFEKANGCRVKIDTFDSNEAMYAKIQSGSSGYDVIFPSSYQVALMAKQGWILPLDKAKLPNVTKNFDAAFNPLLLDTNLTYNIPYAITFTGLAYRKDKIGKADIASWAVLDDVSFKGRVSLLNDMRETIGAALKFLGYSINTVDTNELAKAQAVVLRWKKNIAKFDNEQYKTGVASGEFVIGHGYNGDTAQVIQEDASGNVGFVLPREGFTGACDEMVISKDSKNIELAYKFIDFIFDADNACKNIQYICTVMPNKAAIAKLPKEVKENPAVIPSMEGLKKCEVIRDLGEKNALYIKVWDMIKALE